MILCSTAVVQTTVNRWVAGSNPAGGVSFSGGMVDAADLESAANWRGSSNLLWSTTKRTLKKLAQSSLISAKYALY